jgi:hypothetical protein
MKDMEPDVLRRFFTYRATQLQGLVDAVRDLINHQLTKGIEAEFAVADLLRSVLPSRFSAGKGFIIDSLGHQSNEVDLIVLDAANTARVFDFRAFELIPVEAALACIEVKTRLTKRELDDTFERFHRIQEMEFHTERMMRNWSNPVEGVGMSVVSASRPELIVFAYDSDLSDNAIADAYERYPGLQHAKICVLQRGIIGQLENPPKELCWLKPVEDDHNRFAGQVLALFLFQCFLPALHKQNKGQGFYVKYLQGRSVISQIGKRV